MSVREVDVENGVVRWAKSCGWLVLKINVLGHRGWPDRLFISPEGVHVWIEFKRKGKSPTPLQEHRMSRLNLQQVHVNWYDDTDAAIEYLQECQEDGIRSTQLPGARDQKDAFTAKRGPLP